MAIRVLVNGAKGRMGQLAVKAIEADPQFVLAGQGGRGDKLSSLIKDSEAQVVVDFTQPQSVYKNSLAIIKAGARPVIGTTGLNLRQVKNIQDRCKKLKRGAVIAPNFSLGMVLLMKSAREFVKYFPQVEIIEMHHDRKKDCPSGTALLTAEILAAARSKAKPAPVKTQETVAGARGAQYLKIPIHAVRLPGLVAHEQLIFGGIGETVSLRHDTLDRQCFLRGLLLACKKVMKLQRLVYGLEELL
ncbi:MAG TPA: 4-hydroxy-tetrahydrodipicolinate reductase [Gammaproteobacteria bacterium]|nr:4-hydroxy-tetrahydrodipicolinate reductase [Gammaproteobacteria bacterium]